MASDNRARTRPKVRMRDPAWTQGRSRKQYSNLNFACNDILQGNNNLISYSLGQAEASLCFQEGDCCWGSWKQQRAVILRFFTSLYEPQGFKLASLTTELSFHEQDPHTIETNSSQLQAAGKVYILEQPAPRLVVSTTLQKRGNIDSATKFGIHTSKEEKGSWRYSSFWKGDGQRFTTAIWDWKADLSHSHCEDIGNLHGGILISHDGQPIYLRCKLDGRLLCPNVGLWETTRRILRFDQTANNGHRYFRLVPSSDQNANLENSAAELDDKVVDLIFDIFSSKHLLITIRARSMLTIVEQPSNHQSTRNSISLASNKRSGSIKETLVQATTFEEPENFTHDNYRIAIICALPKELFAVRSLFDQKHPAVAVSEHDTNHYAFGTISGHMVVAASLPSGIYGTCSAANVASQLRASFTNVQFCLLVGIGGGVPSRQHDIRLGDVVVSHPSGLHPGIIKYDFGKAIDDGIFQRTGTLRGPPHFLLSAISGLMSDPDLGTEPLKQHLDKIATQKPEYCFPGVESDVLFESTSSHIESDGYNSSCSNCNGPIVSRPSRTNTEPVVHYGIIASADQVMKSAQLRDEIARKYDALCFEMEAAGVVNVLPTLAIRGICDYSDLHKNDVWQEYASASAASYAKLLLSHIRALI